MISATKLLSDVLRKRACLQSQCRSHVTAFSSMPGTSEISSLAAMLRSHVPSPDTMTPVRETNTFKPDHLIAPAEIARQVKAMKTNIQDDIFRGWQTGKHLEVLSAYSKARLFFLITKSSLNTSAA